MKILYAEDSLELAQAVKLVLEADGHHVTHVLDGAAAVEAYVFNTPDLVLMDVLMPVMGGIEACQKIKAIPMKKWVPFIMLSAKSSNEEVVKGLESGADDYLAKPIDLNVLIARMRSKQRIVDIQNSLFGILDNVHEGIITIDQTGKVQNFNLAAERIFGYVPDEVIGNNINMLMPEPYKTQHDGYLHNYMATNQPKVIGIGRKVQGRRKDGEIFPMHLAVTQIDSAYGMLFIGLVRDISAEEEYRLNIEKLAMTDPLTSLPNRSSFNHQMSARILEGKPFALLFVDIDGFKPVNDNFGHEIGDRVLITLSQRMLGSVAESDFIARLGGDEFVVILKNIPSPLKAEQVGLRILGKIGETMNFKGNECKVGASIGVALYPANGQTSEVLMYGADSAMYEAKRSGKNRVIMAK
jgi:diguanylate cyclase (GGDEF)-like protein/PAS domain S-box-containing protein